MPRIDPLAGSTGVATALPDDEFEAPGLPREHPRWARDAAAISSRARALIARLAPVAIRALTFWDHRVHSLAIGKRELCVDSSGSYRIASR
jgi:hypothetical protein